MVWVKMCETMLVMSSSKARGSRRTGRMSQNRMPFLGSRRRSLLIPRSKPDQARGGEQSQHSNTRGRMTAIPTEKRLEMSDVRHGCFLFLECLG